MFASTPIYARPEQWCNSLHCHLVFCIVHPYGVWSIDHLNTLRTWEGQLHEGLISMNVVGKWKCTLAFHSDQPPRSTSWMAEYVLETFQWAMVAQDLGWWPLPRPHSTWKSQIGPPKEESLINPKPERTFLNKFQPNLYWLLIVQANPPSPL